MSTIVLEGPKISLPARIFKKFKGKKIELVELDDSIVLKPVHDSIEEAKGTLKGCRFSSRTYFEQKRRDKTLEI